MTLWAGAFAGAGAGRMVGRAYASKIVSPNVARILDGYPSAPIYGETPQQLSNAASVGLVRRLGEKVNRIQSGRLNVTLPITLADSGATATTVTDARIGVNSALHWTPLTSDAASIASSIYVSAQDDGSVTLTHSANSHADCSFTLLIMG